MSKTYTFVLDQENFELKVEEKDGKINVILDDDSTQYEVLLNKAPLFSLLVDGHQVIDAEARVEKDKCLVNLEHVPYQIKALDPLQLANGSGAAAAGNIEAPMAGKVIQIKVAEGDSVEAGDILLIIEAMKMQNEITAGQAAKVKSIKTAENDSVEAGQILIELES